MTDFCGLKTEHLYTVTHGNALQSFLKTERSALYFEQQHLSAPLLPGFSQVFLPRDQKTQRWSCRCGRRLPRGSCCGRGCQICCTPTPVGTRRTLELLLGSKRRGDKIGVDDTPETVLIETWTYVEGVTNFVTLKNLHTHVGQHMVLNQPI